MQTQRPVNIHQAYHAHVYFDESSSDSARSLCDQIADKFDLEMGRFHEKAVGPHPVWSCQIKFSRKDFESFIPWLDEHRGDLTIFVHGRSGNDLKDHTEFAYWLGASYDLDLSIFQ